MNIKIDVWIQNDEFFFLQGIFPLAHVVDVDYNDFDPSGSEERKERYNSNSEKYKYVKVAEDLKHLCFFL